MAVGKRTNGLTARGLAMRRLLARWERSGLTLAEFARRTGMRPGTLGWWRHTLRTAERTLADARFRELAVPPALAEVMRPGPAAPFEVVFGDGTVIRVPAAFDAVALERLLTLVTRQRGC